MSINLQTQIIQAQLNRIEERLDTQYGDLRERIEDIRHEQKALAGAMLARLDGHEEYHRRNEHRWGLSRLAARHPFRFAALACTLAMALGAVGVESGPRFVRLLAGLGRLIGP